MCINSLVDQLIEMVKKDIESFHLNTLIIPLTTPKHGELLER